jgi:predicted nucleotidyltransferase
VLTHEEICQAVREAAPKYRIRNAYYFGSYAKGTQTEESDVDLLVEFESGESGGLFERTALIQELEDALRNEVDVVSLPLPPKTRLQIDKAVKCYGNTRPTVFRQDA